MNSQWLTASDLATTLQVSTAHINAMARRGELPSVSLGRIRRFAPDVLDHLRGQLQTDAAKALVAQARKAEKLAMTLANVPDEFPGV